MIEPVKHGAELLREIEESDCESPNLWWLGQSGFAIKYRTIIFYIDPYLSESLTEKYKDTDRPHVRMTRAPFRGHEVTHADLILCTHGHSDHLDPGTVPAMLTASPRAKVVLPRRLAAKAHAAGVGYDRMSTTDSGLRIEFFKDGVYARIYAVPSAHEQLDWTPLEGYACLGYLIRFGNCTIYHSGDCVPYEGLADSLRPFNVTVALLPINGRDPARGVPGNFEIAEAAELARQIGARWLVPMHYDMFTFNTVDVGRFIDYMLFHCPEQRFKVFQCGERWEVPAD